MFVAAYTGKNITLDIVVARDSSEVMPENKAPVHAKRKHHYFFYVGIIGIFVLLKFNVPLLNLNWP